MNNIPTNEEMIAICARIKAAIPKEAQPDFFGISYYPGVNSPAFISLTDHRISMSGESFSDAVTKIEPLKKQLEKQLSDLEKSSADLKATISRLQ